ncbi:MAG: hypothetical protein ACOYBY_16155 [Dermatophilaceae bacterium]
MRKKPLKNALVAGLIGLATTVLGGVSSAPALAGVGPSLGPAVRPPSSVPFDRNQNTQVTDASWWLMEQLLTVEPGSDNGGMYAAKPGYHNTRAHNVADNYSVRDEEDKGGPADKAAAYDWTFPEAQRSKPDYRRINKYSQRLITSGKDPNDPRLNGWREFYGQADSDSDVEGWDFRYDRPVTSDDSHLWHIHLSEDRDKVTNLGNKLALLSVLKGETVQQWRQGSVYINKATNLCLDSDASGRGYTLRCNGGEFQRWHIAANPSSDVVIQDGKTQTSGSR